LAKGFQLLQKLHFMAKNIANSNQEQTKANFNKSAKPHTFNIDGFMWYEDLMPLGKNPKLTAEWQGPAKTTKINDTNAPILLSDGKSKVLNVMCLKKFFLPPMNVTSDNASTHSDLDLNSEPKITGSMTRAMKKLINHKNATQMAINVLCDLSKKHCSMCEW
jgi:hypothetical protein